MELSIFSGIGIIQHLKTEVVDVINSIKELAAEMNIAPGLFFVVGILLALTACVFGYRLLKVLCGIGLAGIGFSIGSALFAFLLMQPGMETLPNVLTYVIAIALAVLFFFLGYKKYAFVVCLLAYFLGSNFMWGLTGDNTLALGGGLLLALLCVLILRISVVVLSSFIGSFLAVGFIGQMIPNMAMLQFSETNDLAFIIALALGVIFMVLQFVFARFYKAES